MSNLNGVLFGAGSTEAASSRRTPPGEIKSPGASATASGGADGIPLASYNRWMGQMLAVDMRHGFWPWVAYLAGVAVFPFYEGSVAHWMTGISVETIWGLAAVAVAAPAVIVRVFCTDFGHGTAERLLTAPVSRMAVWWSRYALVCALLLIPLALSLAALPEQIVKDPAQDRVYYAWQNGSLALLAVLFHLTIGMPCVMLRRPLLVWSTILICPGFMLLLMAFVNSFISSAGPMKVGSLFLPPVYIILIMPIAVVTAAHLWRRLEARS